MVAGFVCIGAGRVLAGVDSHTAALWLFDETQYPNVTLTDAGTMRADLRLLTGVGKPVPDAFLRGEAGIVPGKFGSAIRFPMPAGSAVVWASEGQAAVGTRHFSDRDAEAPERLNLGYFDWTMEFWFRGVSPQRGRGVVWEVRNGAEHYVPVASAMPAGVNALIMDDARKGFVLISRSKTSDPQGPQVNWDASIAIPTDPAKLNDGQWHHLAFAFSRDERQVRHYVDGKLQTLAEKGGWLPLMGQIVSVRLGRDADRKEELVGEVDEFRVSDVARYAKDFERPGSFSRRFGKPRPENKPSGPPLLFGNVKPGVIELGGRKHVFIDGALLEKQENVKFVANPPSQREVTDFRSTEPWEASPRFGASVSDICSIIDDGNGKLRMLYTNGGFWGNRRHAVCLAESTDGLHWTKPELGVVSWDGSTKNNIVLRDACQGTMFKDENPNTPHEEQYRYVAWCVDRGFYVFSSPDCVHWTRNESAAIPFDPDGSSETFWDDQAGVYRAYFRSLIFDKQGAYYRAVVRAIAPDLLSPWPFTPAKQPQWHVFTLPKPTDQEFPVVDAGGQAYRLKGIKYPWAPDTYLAFPWRYVGKKNIRPGSPMMVSRDGENWTLYEPPYYFASGWELDGRKVLEALSEQGMVRRGDEIWQYMTVRFTEHGGALYGGVEHEGGVHDRVVRTTQRLDGFVSLENETGKPGIAVSKPFTFKGQKLEVNAIVKESLKVALLDADGKPIDGFTVADCKPVKGDSVRHVIEWKNGSNVSTLAGKTCQLWLELDDAKLFALQFVESAAAR
jgi:hypothetical protein